ncbi:MAG: ornithine cyclodeaminase family protein, partial [Gemmataceae bacterium]
TLNALGFKAYTTAKTGNEFRLYLFDPKLGHLAAIVEADYLGQLRTGAASGAATKKLARADAHRAGIFGTGRQARTQLEAIAAVRKLSRVTVYSRDEDRRIAFAAVMSATLELDVVPTNDPRMAAHAQDIVITATSSREPVLLGEWLVPGTHLNLIGSNFLAKTEVDVALFRRADLVTVDSKDQARLEAGDFVAALGEGVLKWPDIYEFAHVFTGKYPGRQAPEDITVFKSLGLGIEDIAVGMKALEAAREQGRGRVLLD